MGVQRVTEREREREMGCLKKLLYGEFFVTLYQRHKWLCGAVFTVSYNIHAGFVLD